jgi:hypothetical protein
VELGDFLRDLARVLVFWGLKSDRPEWRQANRLHDFSDGCNGANWAFRMNWRAAPVADTTR